MIGNLFGSGESEEVLFKVRVIPLIHLLILFILTPLTLLIFNALLRIEFNWVLVIVNFSFWGLLFMLFILSILFSRLYVYKWGIRFRISLINFDDISRVRLKWGKRLLVINRRDGHWLIEQHWYLLPNSSSFIREIESLKPELDIDYE